MGFFKNIGIHISHIEDYYIDQPSDPSVGSDLLYVDHFFLKPGQFFKYDKYILECVPIDNSGPIDCSHCDAQLVLPRQYCVRMACDATERPDGKKVIFRIKK